MTIGIDTYSRDIHKKKARGLLRPNCLSVHNMKKLIYICIFS
jgi:hypothetical protein